MAAATLLFADDRMHSSVAATSIVAASSTRNGYNRDCVREANLIEGWKPNNSFSDESLRVDGGSTTWLGNVGDTVYCVVAYDARNSGQDLINLRYYPNDDGLLASTIVSLATDKRGPTVDYGTFTIPSNSNGLPKRLYELVQKGADRTSTTIAVVTDATVSAGSATCTTISGTGFENVKEGDGISGPNIPANTTVLNWFGPGNIQMSNNATGSGTPITVTFTRGQTAIILAWGMFKSSGVISLGSGGTALNFPSDDVDRSSFRPYAPLAGMQVGSGARHTNRGGATQMDFDVALDQATKALWEQLRDTFSGFGGPGRAFFLQYEGLRNYARANFQMVRLRDPRWASERNQRELYDKTALPLRTEGFI